MRILKDIKMGIVNSRKLLLVLSLLSLISFSHSATLNIYGVSEEKKEEYYAELEPRLDYILQREASPWRADDAAFLLKRVMIRRGFPDVVVDWKLPGANIIDLQVIPGVQYLFGDIVSQETTAISQEELKEYFLQPLVEREAVRIKDAPYIEDYVEKGTVNVKNYLKSRGYWNAAVSVSDKNTDQDKKTINITLDVDAGNLLTLSQPRYEGTKKEDIARFTPNIQELTNQPATTQNINLIKRGVEKYYEDNGYQLAKMTMRTKHSNTSTQLNFVIKSGAQYRVNVIIVEGVEKTKPRRISRYFRRQEGKNYDQAEIDRIVTRIVQTGGFKGVIVKPEPIPGTDLLNLHVRVRETKAKRFRSYVGFGNFEGYIIGGGYSDSNFNGDLRKLYYGAEFSGRGLLGELGINEPRIFNTPLDANARMYLIDRYNEGYDVRKFGLESSLTWSPSQSYLTRFYANVELGASATDSLTNAELGPSGYLVSRFGVEQTVDFRNNRLSPSDGFHGRVLLESGAINGDVGTGFFRAELESSYRYSINEENQLSGRFLYSALRPEETNDLPIDVRLFSGGVNTQRAYTERELGPQSASGDPLGGEAYWVGSLEYIRSFSSLVQGVIFLDAGQLYTELGDFTLGDPSYAAGLGIRIDLPIGPVRLEYGHNLNRQSGERNGTFHFSIGASF